MSNEYKDWLRNKLEEEDRIVNYVRDNGFTYLTDEGIICFYNYCNDVTTMELDDFLDWLEHINLYQKKGKTYD